MPLTFSHWQSGYVPNSNPITHLLHFSFQLNSRNEQHLENISRLQLYEYQLDESLCPNAPPSATSDPFSHRINESPGYTNNDRSSCLEEDSLALRVGTASERSKDNLRSVRSKDSLGSEGTMGISGSKDTSSGGTRVAAVRKQVGLLAQEVQRVLPNAVRVTVSFKCVCVCVCVRVCACVRHMCACVCNCPATSYYRQIISHGMRA